MWKNNRGYSLVELLVTIAIMAVLMGGGLIAYNIVLKTDVRKAANTLNDTLSICRQKAKVQSQTDWMIRINYSGRTPAVEIWSGAEGESEEPYSTSALPSQVRCTVTAYDDSGAVLHTYKMGDADAGATAVGINYAKLNGRITKIEYRNSASSGTIGTGGFTDFTFENNGTKITVRLYYATGKQEMIE